MADFCELNMLQDTVSYNLVKTAEIASAVLSTCVTLAFLIMAITLKLYREFLFKIVIGITMMGFLFSITPFIRSQLPNPTDTTCNIFGLIETCWAFASLCWCSCFAHAAHLVAKGRSPQSVKKYFWIYLMISILLPAACIGYFVVTESSLNCYESKSLYCRISYNKIDLQVFLLAMIVWLCSSAFIIFFYKKIRSEMTTCGLHIKHRVYILPLASLVCWIPLLFGYYKAHKSEIPPSWFIFIQTISLYLYGILNVIIYGFCKRTRLECMRCLRRKSGESSEHKEDSKHQYQHSLMPDSLLEAKSTDQGRATLLSNNRTIHLSHLQDSFI